ncbi:hypothetical protein M3P05_20430, partial [Sansalvadorimonas sp. 2012CJ34-2]
MQEAVFEFLTIPKLKKIILENNLRPFDERSVAYGNLVIEGHDDFFGLLINNMSCSDSVIDMFLKIPETFRPYLLWWLTKQEKFKIVNQILSEHTEYKSFLHVIDESSGNSCLHEALRGAGFYEFRTLVETAELHSLFGKKNLEGKLPHDFYNIVLFDAYCSNLLMPLDVVCFLLKVRSPVEVQELLERLLVYFDGKGITPLIHIVAYALQNGLTLGCCSSIYQDSRYRTDHFLQLERAYPLLSACLPVAVENYKALADQLIKSDLPSQTIICILVALPEPYSQKIMAEILQSRRGHSFVKGLLNTG